MEIKLKKQSECSSCIAYNACTLLSEENYS